jgi:GNAT superfamily N-acetyltransferase
MSSASLDWREERDDESFLRELFASTRVDELAPLGWSASELDAFLTMQFDAQRAQYRANHPDADFLVLTLGPQRVGRLYVDRGETSMLLIDIIVLPHHRGGGLGTAVMQRLMADAERARQPLRLSAAKTSPALRLYRRLGFATIADHGLTWHMEWRGEDSAGLAAAGDVASEGDGP